MSTFLDEVALTYIMQNMNILTESRIQYLKDNTEKLDTSHDPTGKHKNVADIVDHFAEHGDPTKNKAYTQYIVGLYKRGSIRQEDASRVHSTLSDFDKYKHKLEPSDKQVNFKNYPTLSTLRDKVQPFVDAGLGSNKTEQGQIDRQKEWNLPNKHELKYDDSNIKIYKLMDKDTSKFLYGKKNHKTPGVFPSDWCTASQDEDHNYYDHYINNNYPGSNLYVIHRKSDGHIFQYHVHSDQFMDKDDNTISDSDWNSIKPSVHKAWSQDRTLLHDND